jgi:hypothetical protein
VSYHLARSNSRQPSCIHIAKLQHDSYCDSHQPELKFSAQFGTTVLALSAPFSLAVFNYPIRIRISDCGLVGCYHRVLQYSFNPKDGESMLLWPFTRPDNVTTQKTAIWTLPWNQPVVIYQCRKSPICPPTCIFFIPHQLLNCTGYIALNWMMTVNAAPGQLQKNSSICLVRLRKITKT